MKAYTYKDYPMQIVLLSNAVSLGIYLAGAIILSGFGALAVVGYILLVLWVEAAVLRGSCVNCYYYGRTCAFGKGRLCSLLFRRGSPAKFNQRQVSWKNLLPDFLVLLVPLAGGAALLLGEFSWLTAGLMVALLVLSLGGNAWIRGTFACKHCKQRLLGCPAEKIFNVSPG